MRNHRYLCVLLVCIHNDIHIARLCITKVLFLKVNFRHLCSNINISLDDNYLQPIRVVKKLIPSVSRVSKRIHEGKVGCVIAFIHLFPLHSKGCLFSIVYSKACRDERGGELNI